MNPTQTQTDVFPFSAASLVQVERTEGVATLWLNRADKRNAWNQPLLLALAEALDQVRDDASVQVVVLRGRGPVFSSGIDHSLLSDLYNRSQEVPFRHLHRDLHAVLNRMTQMEKPVIAVLHGMAVGMALEVALAADLRVARADTLFGLPEVAFGILPDVGGTTRLTRLVGTARAKEVILTGGIFKADQALSWGVVNRVGEDDAGVEAALQHLVSAMTAHPAAAVGLAKALIDRVAEVDDATALQLEGVYQSLLLTRPELMERFMPAVGWIQAEIKKART